MTDLNTLLKGLMSSGSLTPEPDDRSPSPVPLEMRAKISERTARLSRNVAGNLTHEEFRQLMDADPRVARSLVSQIQGSPVPEFPMGGLG